LKEIETKIANRLGLHARAAARFVKLASRFQSRITVSKDASRVDGKSILGLLTLAAREGTRLRLTAEGDDAAEALAQLDELVRDRFGEDE
jgi:phosphocarrier protein HPr